MLTISSRGYRLSALRRDRVAAPLAIDYPVRHRRRWRSTDESVKGARSSSGFVSAFWVLVVERGCVPEGSVAGTMPAKPRHGGRISRPTRARSSPLRGVVCDLGVSAGVTLLCGRGRPPSEAQVLGLMPAAQLAPQRAFEVASRWRRPRPAWSLRVPWVVSRRPEQQCLRRAHRRP